MRFSLNLSYTLGCPASNRIVFVHPVKCQTLTENRNGKQCDLAASYISLDSCKELYLSPIYSKGKLEMEDAISCHLNLSKEATYDKMENNKISSPKTPSLSESRLGSPHSIQSRRLNYGKSLLKTNYLSYASVNLLDMEEVLGDDSSRKLVENCISSWLRSRSLLSRNFVIVPILSGLCLLQVVGSKRLSPNSEIWNCNNHDSPSGAPDTGQEMVYVFSPDWGTKIHLMLPGNAMHETSMRSSSAHPELARESTKIGMGVNLPVLGGLSKEYAVLKDIILSSAAQVTVTRCIS